MQLAQADPDPEHPLRRRILDKVLRDGILEGYHHASEHVTIAEILMRNAAGIVSCLGVFSVRHLQSKPRSTCYVPSCCTVGQGCPDRHTEGA
ncbi:hypothetical protein ACCO45_005615 [Purpureocillium lilacinum]|uniref:Uncharacterized protein n=1 Tax=Purpureocillium lilacinum TaxID=33203 RepID=A0ACC4DWU2_PURLI